MAEPISQVVASMPRGRFVALMALFLGPAVAVYTLFSIYPLIATMGLSTYTTDSGGAYHFAGLANFVTLLTDSFWSKPFWNAAKNNLIFFFVHMAVQNPIGIALAGLLSLPGLKLKGLYRTIIFLPTMLSVVIVGFAWNLILSPLWGVAEGALKAVGLGSLFAPWLGLPSTALVTLALISVWQFVGIPLMLIYAALLNIPDELVDAARVDGLGHFRIFLHIKLPLVLPDDRPHLGSDLRRQLQRLRPHLFGQGSARRAQFRLGHSRHVFLSHFLRQSAAARQSDDGGGGGDRDVLHHPRRRLPLSLHRAAPLAALRVLGRRAMLKQRAQILGVHAILIAYCALALGPILLVVMNSFKTRNAIFGAPLAPPTSATLLAHRLHEGVQRLAYRNLFHEFADRDGRQHGRSCCCSARWPPGR